MGDAAGYVDALTGEGIGAALRTAAALAECVSRDRVDRYEAAWRSATRRYRTVTSVLLAAAVRPRWHRTVVPAAESLPGVFTGAVRMLAQG